MDRCGESPAVPLAVWQFCAASRERPRSEHYPQCRTPFPMTATDIPPHVRSLLSVEFRDLVSHDCHRHPLKPRLFRRAGGAAGSAVGSRALATTRQIELGIFGAKAENREKPRGQPTRRRFRPGQPRSETPHLLPRLTDKLGVRVPSCSPADPVPQRPAAAQPGHHVYFRPHGWRREANVEAPPPRPRPGLNRSWPKAPA
jgi:hypothetical protein